VKREPLFEGWWTDTAAGARLERATRQQLREANRLWWKHRDLRERPARTPESKDSRVIDDHRLDDVVADEWTQIGLDSLGERSA
jgi:hypothetical protein